jgi:hypothetical protein
MKILFLSAILLFINFSRHPAKQNAIPINKTDVLRCVGANPCRTNNPLRWASVKPLPKKEHAVPVPQSQAGIAGSMEGTSPRAFIVIYG